MYVPSLTAFFQWCTILDGAVLVVWAAAVIFAPNLLYRSQSLWFPMPRETFHVVNYCLLGLFKILFLVFNAIPYLVLLHLGG